MILNKEIVEIEVIFSWKVARVATFWSIVIKGYSLLFITDFLLLRRRLLNTHLNFLTCKEAWSGELSLLLLYFERILGFSCFFLQQARSVNEMAAWKIKDGVLCANAILTIVRITIDRVLLLHTQAVDHLAHPLSWLRPYNSLSNLLLFPWTLHLETVWHVYLLLSIWRLRW